VLAYLSTIFLFVCLFLFCFFTSSSCLRNTELAGLIE